VTTVDRRFLCLDVGGTNTRIGVVNDRFEVLDSAIEGTVALAATSVGDGIASLVTAWASRAAWAGRLSGIVVGVPATVDAACRAVLQAPNVEGLSGLALADLIEAASGLPVVVEKDVNLLILSDIQDLGIDAGSSVAGIYFGTGVGNALYLGGSLWRGAHGVAGELGHVPQLGGTQVCGCGNVGCLECYGGGHHLVGICAERFPHTPIGEVFARHGDAPEVLGFLDSMAIAVATEANILDPDEVIVGGGIPAMGGFPRKAFEERVYERLRKPCPAGALSIRYSRQGQLSGLVGGAIRMTRGGALPA
jgi:allose kinase